MAASRFLQCRNILTSNITLMRTSKWTAKTFSILSLSHKVGQKFSPIRSLKILSKPKVNLEFLIRKTASVAATAPAATKIASEGLVKRKVGYWLVGCSALVYWTISIGAYTRLTESGLSMVTWRLTFEKFPSNDEEWEAEFEKYKQFPEYKLLKKNLTLEEFKTIFNTEYLHRSMGRTVGLFFTVPALVFWLRGYFKQKMKLRVMGFVSLIFLQGLFGWYMVKSGLEDRFDEQTDIPRVSQYRLATHLGLALTLYTGLMLTAMDLLLPVRKPTTTILPGARKLRMLAHSCKGLIFLTAISGAFVAGLDAGLVYSSFPKMGDKWIPDDILALTPLWKNFTENPTTVQFNHRILGITTFSTIMAMWLLSKNKGLPRRANFAMNLLAVFALCQVGLGISTLVHHVPLPLALSHQTGSVFLLTSALWLSHELKFLKYVPK